MIVTFDLFSALTDTRTGAWVTFAEIASERGWSVTGTALYDTWDERNKAGQRQARPPTSFRDVSLAALCAAYDDLDLGSAHGPSDLARLHASIPQWPLWPDVEDAVARVATLARVGLLSNVDDDLTRLTRAHALSTPTWC